jgi:hypothetical protein
MPVALLTCERAAWEEPPAVVKAAPSSKLLPSSPVGDMAVLMLPPPLKAFLRAAFRNLAVEAEFEALIMALSIVSRDMFFLLPRPRESQVPKGQRASNSPSCKAIYQCAETLTQYLNQLSAKLNLN